MKEKLCDCGECHVCDMSAPPKPKPPPEPEPWVDPHLPQKPKKQPKPHDEPDLFAGY